MSPGTATLRPFYEDLYIAAVSYISLFAYNIPQTLQYNVKQDGQQSFI